MKNNIGEPRVEIDVVDLKIIEILKNDSSRPFVDIAKEIGTSDATVHIRGFPALNYFRFLFFFLYQDRVLGPLP